MSHVHVAPVDINTVVEAGPIQVASKTTFRLWVLLLIGVGIFCYGLLFGPAAKVWGAFYVNYVYFQGLALGGVMTTVIMQIVRAKWGAPIRRLAEANVRFFPVALICFLTTFLGKEYLFTWAREPMPGREFWMQPTFVYVRFTVLFGFLFFMSTRFVYMSLRGDIGLAQERVSKSKKAMWSLPTHAFIARNWRGSEREIIPIQRKMSTGAPMLVLFYAVIVSLFSFEMIMGMNSTWYSNLFGAFIFVSQIYIGWAGLALMTMYFSRNSKSLGDLIHSQQLWDIGKLTFGFCMLWGYMFWSQFLPQWYGNLPEETQWLILRTREFPWKELSWLAFPMAFIIPFITLLSRDVKRTPVTYALVCLTLMSGVWLDRYIIIMPEISPNEIPFGVYEIGIFIGFLSAYLLCIRNFLSQYPYVPISHPLTHGSNKW